MQKTFVSRKLVVSAAIAAGVMWGAGLKPACAGEWVEVPNPISNHSSQAWKDENGLRLSGTTSWSVPSSWWRSPSANTRQWKDIGQDDAGFDVLNDTYINGYGGPGNSGSHGTRKILFRWKPEWIIDFDTWMFYPDPNDAPPENLNLKITANVLAEAWNGDGQSGGGHSASTSVEDVSDSGQYQEGNGLWQSSVQKVILKTIPTNGQYEVWTPPISFGLDVQLNGTDPNRESYARGFLICGRMKIVAS
jgi:hypothetical protein